MIGTVHQHGTSRQMTRYAVVVLRSPGLGCRVLRFWGQSQIFQVRCLAPGESKKKSARKCHYGDDRVARRIVEKCLFERVVLVHFLNV